ncbi:MAG: tyrosine-protein phosphatase [Candidatus Staskawiczbacteria bacterium]|nr:tyrosine-protein phosphatase [Candidatus Staskawiczbacteria bacterium]
MKKQFLILTCSIIIIVLILCGVFVSQYLGSSKTSFSKIFVSSKDFVGPRSNVNVGTPAEAGFNDFSVVVPGVISRSGQPTLQEFQWLKANGWKSVIDLRKNKEYGEVANDQDIKGFSDLGFNYLWLQITDGSVPTIAQAKQFLAFVSNSANQPIEIHCRKGVGRAGTMTALYRYQIQGWPMDKAISESRLYSGGVNLKQTAWLNNWAKNNPH